ncbi:MAG: hypothetical protein ACREEQ_05940, partial [Caulobacteraceae bacterium]
MDFTGFANSFTAGEIAPDAQDRVDIDPIQRGLAQAINMTVTSSGPLRKRRGFWRVSAVANQANAARLVPFRNAISDALMLEFGHLSARVWLSNGAPLLNAGAQVSFATPYAASELAALRWKQVADVIYFRTADGEAPQALERLSDTDWAFNAETYPNGPWLTENTDLTSTVTVTGADEENNGAGCILVGTAVTLAASEPIFNAGQVGASFRTRATSGTASTGAWAPGFNYPVGHYVVSAGHLYKCTAQGADPSGGSNPPVHLYGSPAQSDGSNMWDYRHDGAGVIQIETVTSPTAATGVVLSTHPLPTATATSYWSECAYSAYRGWPTAWPALREERLVGGGTSNDPSFIDLTESAGFYPTNENFHPGTGMDVVLATDAIRLRLGDDHGQLVWTATPNYLLAGTDSAEYLVAGSVLDEPLSPLGPPTVKRLSSFGSDPVCPAMLWNGLCFVQRGGQTLRWMSIDNGQGFT